MLRYFKPCTGCDWVEVPNGLATARWYASNQILSYGKIIVVSCRQQFSYEFIPKSSNSDYKLHGPQFLSETRDLAENNMYLLLHLSTDGNLFIFANNPAILLDYVNHRVVRNDPVMPGGVSRNFPSTGSSVLLPLKLSITNKRPDAQVIICGGSQSDSLQKAMPKVFVPATITCVRLTITEVNPKWEMEEMLWNRILGDMISLPIGDILIVNGAGKGSAGWDLARGPVLHHVLYSFDRYLLLVRATW